MSNNETHEFKLPEKLTQSLEFGHIPERISWDGRSDKPKREIINTATQIASLLEAANDDEEIETILSDVYEIVGSHAPYEEAFLISKVGLLTEVLIVVLKANRKRRPA